MIDRYTLGERVVHWVSAFSYMYVLATGLAFYSPHLYWLAAVLGGGSTSRYWHPWIGLVFLATLVWMVRVWRGDLRITKADREWGKAMRHYVRNEDALVPPSDRFNPGQKYYFWAMVYAGLVLLLSGAVLWMPELIPWSWRGLRFAAILLHVAAALVTIGAFMIHIYMGVFAVRGGLAAIVTGQVSSTWAKHHHRLWYQRIGGQVTVWERRIERARELELQYPAAVDLLRFYREVAAFQSTLKGEVPIPPEADPEAVEAFRALVLAQARPRPASKAAPPLQHTMQVVCPLCGEKPVAAVLRPEGDGGKRFLLCSVCLKEWEFRRILCPNCGEEDLKKLPVFGAKEYDYIRVEACDTCKTYIKSIDMTRNGLAVPEVDELASLALDLWAIEKGYTKLQPNLFGM